MRRRYATVNETVVDVGSQQPDPLRRALDDGHVALIAEGDGTWELRWRDTRQARINPTGLDPATPMDVAYSHATRLQGGRASAVSVRLDPTDHRVASSTTATAEPRPQAWDIAIRAANPDPLREWATQRLGVAGWRDLNATTTISSSTR